MFNLLMKFWNDEAFENVVLAQESANQTTPPGFTPICGDCDLQITLTLCAPNNWDKNYLE